CRPACRRGHRARQRCSPAPPHTRQSRECRAAAGSSSSSSRGPVKPPTGDKSAEGQGARRSVAFSPQKKTCRAILHYQCFRPGTSSAPAQAIPRWHARPWIRVACPLGLREEDRGILAVLTRRAAGHALLAGAKHVESIV